MRNRLWLVAGAVLVACSTASAAEYPFSFKDVGDDTGAFPHVAGIRGHAAAWGDADGDGWPELFVGTFHNAGSKPGVFLWNCKGKFTLDKQEHLKTSGIGSGALFVDLTNSGKLDLYASHCAHPRAGALAVPSLLFRNDGEGKFTDVSKDSGACPPDYSGRGLAALDFDGDGLLDLVTCEQYYGKVKIGPCLFRNKGGYKFENVSEAAGLPAAFAGLGVAVADFNRDGWPDIFLTGGAGDHRLLLNDGKGKFREAPGAREVFQWKTTGDNPPAGVCIADVNRDGLPDVVIGNHFEAPWRVPASIRLYLNRGVKDGVPKFEDVTEAAGIKTLEMKAPHVEIQDFDNDGLPDIYVSIVKFAADGKPCPVIYKNLGIKDGIPQFRDDAWAVNDFPNADDKAARGSARLFEKILKDKKIIYMAAAPSCDFDRDGKLDLFLANWWIVDRSLLLKNETKGGNYLDVRVEGKDGVNRMGIGSRIDVYPAGKLGEAASLLGSREISIGYGYCSGQEAIAHFGLGKEETIDIEVTLPHGKGKLTQKGVKANQALTVKP